MKHMIYISDTGLMLYKCVNKTTNPTTPSSAWYPLECSWASSPCRSPTFLQVMASLILLRPSSWAQVSLWLWGFLTSHTGPCPTAIPAVPKKEKLGAIPAQSTIPALTFEQNHVGMVLAHYFVHWWSFKISKQSSMYLEPPGALIPMVLSYWCWFLILKI